jgi:hypothetical protein
MRILKRRDKLDKTITVRVPDAIKAELERLRERADAAGFDVGATLRESLIVTIRQIAAELDTLERKQLIQPGDGSINGNDHNLSASNRVRAA